MKEVNIVLEPAINLHKVLYQIGIPSLLKNLTVTKVHGDLYKNVPEAKTMTTIEAERVGWGHKALLPQEIKSRKFDSYDDPLSFVWIGTKHVKYILYLLVYTHPELERTHFPASWECAEEKYKMYYKIEAEYLVE